MNSVFRSSTAKCLVAGLACLVLAGCGPSSVSKTRVSGTVTVNGEPVKVGVIGFEPKDPSQPSATADIRDGKFEILSPHGQRRVSIMAYRQAKGLGPDGKPYQEQYLPKRFNLESDRTIEVGATPLDDQKFELTVPEKELK